MASTSSANIRGAVAVLKKGGVVVFPTETAYGLAVDSANTRAIRKIYDIKGRDAAKQLPWIAATASMAEREGKVSARLMKIAKKHWPGPLTVVGLKAAIRVSSHPIARALSKGLGRPIISTSANRSGQPTCYSVRAVKKQFVGQTHQPDFVIDVGALPHRKPSTIIAEHGAEVVVLRQGSVRV